MSEKGTVMLRPATPMDSVNIVRLLKGAWAESAAKEIAEFNEQKALEYVTTTLKRCFVVVVETSGRLLGSLAMVPIPLPWSGDVVMAEAWFIVIPQFRAKGVPEKLMGAVDLFLDRNKLPAILGTNLLAPGELDAVFKKRSSYRQARASFVRLPVPLAKAAGT